MRGSPLARALLAFLLIGSLGWPLWQLTRPQAVLATAARSASVSIKRAIDLHLTFTTAPKAFVIRYLEADIWQQSVPPADVEKRVLLDYPEEGIDLQFHIEWPDNIPAAAMRVQLTDPAGNAHEKTLWGKGTVDDVLTFP